MSDRILIIDQAGDLVPVEQAIYESLLRLESKLNLVLAAQAVELQMEESQMADLSALQAEVQQNGDVVDSAVALLNNIAQQLRDAGTDPAAIAALADELDAKTNELADAVAANTPADPNAGGGTGEPTP